MKLLGGATSNRTPLAPGRVTGVGAVALGALAVAGAGSVGAPVQVTGVAAFTLGGLAVAAAGAPIATQVTGVAAVQLGALTTAAAGSVNAVDLWENVTHNFPGTTLNTTLWNGTYGTAPTVHDNQLDWTALSGNYAGVQAIGGRSLIGSHVSIQLPVLNAGGFGGIALKSDSGNVLIVELQVVSTGVRTAYQGSNWGGANDTSTNTAITPVAGCYLRIREDSGTVYTEYSADGWNWTTVDTYTPSASALAALADSRLEVFCGPFPNAMTSGPAFANLNIVALSVPTAAFAVGTEVGVPTGTSLTTRTSLGSPTSTGTYDLVDPTGRQPPATVNVDIFENLRYTTNRIVTHRTTGNVRLFRNCSFEVLNESSMVEADEEGTGGTTGYMTPRQIFERCTFDGNLSSGKALSGGNLWAVGCHIADCEDGAQGPFCSVFIDCNIIGGTDGLADPHADGTQLLGIGKAIYWHCFVSAGSVSGAASQALRIGAEFGGNDDVTIGWCLLDGDAGGWTLQARGDNHPTEDNTNIRVHDTVILPGGFGSVDFVESSTSLWERVYSDTYGGTPIADPGT